MSEQVTAFAPASIGNVAVGFDMLGLALEGVGDRVSAQRVDTGCQHCERLRTGWRSSSRIFRLIRAQHGVDRRQGAAGTTMARQRRRAEGIQGRAPAVRNGQFGGFSGRCSRCGERAARYAATDRALLSYALVGEQYASGGLHADNVAPSLLGGLIFCPQVLLPEVVRLPVPQGVSAALLHPELQVNTAHARRSSQRRSRWSSG